LIVHSRKAQTKALTHEEILAAAEKFLMPADLQPFGRNLSSTLVTWSPR